jgi:cullin-associated NEDD8-dissociated protein 1
VFIPLLLDYSQRAAAASDGDELAEVALFALESIVVKCPRDTLVYWPRLMDVCCTALSYDPNYAYDDDQMDSDSGAGIGDDVNMTNSDDGQTSDHGDNDTEYSDDDDLSWKVRVWAHARAHPCRCAAQLPSVLTRS